MKLTKATALKACIKIWDALAKSGANVKPDNNYEHDCPCCEYCCQRIPDQRHAGMDCAGNDDTEGYPDILKLCPLESLWPTGCQHAGPYLQWMSSGEATDRRIAAKAIADGARVVLRKLNRKP